MNLSPLRQIFSDVTTRAAQFYKNSIPLSGQQTLSSLKQFLTPTFANYNSSKQNDIIFHQLSQNFSPGLAQQDNSRQVKDEVAQKLWSSLSGEIKQQITKAVAGHKNDIEFREMLGATISDPKFSKLDATGQSVVITHLDRIACTDSYLKMKRPERLASMYVITDLSFYAVAHPKFKMAWNTLEHITSGRVKMGIENLSTTNLNDSRGSYDPKTNTMYFNIGNANLLKDSQGLMRTAAHEINHALNSRAANNRVEVFLDEYRAFYVQGAATGEYPPSSTKMKQHVTNLLNHPIYNFSLEKSKDSGFRKVIDTILLKLDRGEVMDPEELRQNLLALQGREKSVYLNTKPNMDNH